MLTNRTFQLLVALAAAAIGCGGDNGTHADASFSGADAAVGVCDDGVGCTTDVHFTSTDSCEHQPDPSRCAAGQTCDPVRGCVAGHACANDASCVDTDSCTVDERCDGATRVCVWRPFDGDGDGFAPASCGGADCNDAAPLVHPGLSELCDMHDDDCDGMIDESCTMVEYCSTTASNSQGTCRGGADYFCYACAPGDGYCVYSFTPQTCANPLHPAIGSCGAGIYPARPGGCVTDEQRTEICARQPSLWTCP